MFSNPAFEQLLIKDGKKFNPNLRKIVASKGLTEEINQLLGEDIAHTSTIKLIEVLWLDYHKIRPMCSTCGSFTKFSGWLPGWNRYCDASCQMKDPEQTLIRKEDALKRFGVNNYLRKKSSVQAVIATKATEEYKIRFRDSIRNSFIDPAKVKIRTEKMIKSRSINGKKPWLHRFSALSDTLKELNFEVITTTTSGKPITLKHSCGAVQPYGRWSGEHYLCSACSPNTRIKAETSFFNTLESEFDILIKRNVYHGPYKFDGMIDNLVIEFNGLFWHSTAAFKAGFGKELSPNYHYDKFKYCEKHGLKIIQIFEDEINLKSVNRIRNAIGKAPKIFARKCKLVEIESKIATTFLKEFHGSGSVPQRLSLALESDGKLVAVATFGKTRFGKRDRNELLRFATDGSSVTGGLSRLLKLAAELLDSDIMSYSDNFWGTGAGYLSAGAILEKEVKPGYFYFDKKNFNRVSRFAMQKHNFEKVFGLAWDDSLLPEENAALVHCFRVYDAGKNRWVFKKKLA